MKRIFSLFFALLFALGFSACSGDASGSTQSVSSTPTSERANSVVEEESARVLVAYFSATGNTAEIAQSLQEILSADLYEIVPQQSYTEADLNYSDDSCRANQEQNDPAARPAMNSALENPEDYDVIFLGYPIWWGKAPKIIFTFLESSDFAGKTIVPFCTSGSSGIDPSVEELQNLVPEGTWLSGQRFSAGASKEEIADWVEGLGLEQNVL